MGKEDLEGYNSMEFDPKKLTTPQEFADALRHALIPVVEIHQAALAKGMVLNFQMKMDNGKWAVAGLSITQAY